MVSRMCPGKRDFVKKGNQKKQRRILLDSLKNLHKKFVEENNISIPYSTFARARPFWVTHPKSKDRDTCACIIHSNIDLLISGLKSFNALTFRNGKEALDSIVCSVKNDLCMTDKCDSCKGKKIVFNDSLEPDINVKFYQWRTVQEKKAIKGKERIIKRMAKEKDVKKLSDLKEKLNTMIKVFKKHVYHMLHQATKKKFIRNNLTRRELMLTIDFSENYCAKYQEEVQSMHFGASKRQISLHTSVLYYFDGEQVIPRSYCTVSDNLAHQAHAVWAHLDPILDQMGDEFPQTKLLHIFSDSPSSQYRNRTNLWLLKTKLQNYFPLLKYCTWNFSEPGHGKGAMDGVGGSLKRRADELVLHGHDVRNAKDIVKWFTKSKTRVIEVPSRCIENAKRELPNNIDSVAKIMQLKQVAFSLEKNVMFGRSLSCFECLTEKPCSHYNVTEIFPNKIKSRKRTVEEVWPSSDEDENYAGPGQSGLQNTEDTNKTNFDSSSLDNIKIGSYILVRYNDESKKFGKAHQFLGVVQDKGDDSSDIQVMFLKNVNNDKTSFYVNEKDVAFISAHQIVAVLPQPNLMLKGDRVYYKFNFTINVF